MPRGGATGRPGGDELRERRRIAHACEQLVGIVESLREPIRGWGSVGARTALPAPQRAYLGAHALTILDTVLIDLVAVRARLADALAAPPCPDPDPGPGTWPPPELGDPAPFMARAFDRSAKSMRYISISLDQWAARTPDDYDEAARASAGMRALSFLDAYRTGFVPVRDALAADLDPRYATTVTQAISTAFGLTEPTTPHDTATPPTPGAPTP